MIYYLNIICKRTIIAKLHHDEQRSTRVCEGGQVFDDILVLEFPEDFDFIMRF